MSQHELENDPFQRSAVPFCSNSTYEREREREREERYDAGECMWLETSMHPFTHSQTWFLLLISGFNDLNGENIVGASKLPVNRIRSHFRLITETKLHRTFTDVYFYFKTNDEKMFSLYILISI